MNEPQKIRISRTTKIKNGSIKVLMERSLYLKEYKINKNNL